MISFPYKHIIWDWNGTLLNDSWLSVEVINGVLSRRNMPTIDHDHYIQIFGFPVIDYYERLGFDFEMESFEIVGTEFIRGYEERRHETQLHPGVRDVLQQIQQSGVTQSILSAYKQETLDELVGYFDLKDFFLKIIGLDNHYAHSKLENGKQWMETLHHGPHEVLFVGDTVHDYEVAEAIGADCVLIPGGHQPKAVLEATGAKVVNDVTEILTTDFQEKMQ